MLKSVREKQLVKNKEALIRLSADYSRETLKARREWQEIFQVMKSKDLQPRLLYPAWFSFKMEGQIRSFPRQEKAKRRYLHQTSIAIHALGTNFRRWRKTKREWGTQVQRENIAMNKHLSVRTLNVNGLNVSIKRHSVAEWIRKHDPYACCLQGNQSEQKVYTSWTWRDGKKYFKKIDI